MRPEDELLSLARDRESACQSSLLQMVLDPPSKVRRQLRNYLAEQANCGRLKRTYDVPRLDTLAGGLQELVCEEVEFLRSDSRLSFKIRMEQEQAGWLVKQFKFFLSLPGRKIAMIQIHLDEDGRRDPLKVPRCHFHIGDSKAHIPFPVMSPRLIVHLICEHIEPDKEL